MRVSGGKARGVRLKVSKRSVHRPAMDKTRQSVFSSLGEAIIGASVCDLFAGTGSYGLEALSRGAKNAVFIERNRDACQMIKDNLLIVAKSMAVPTLTANVVPLDITKWRPSGDTFDVIFVDPPYDGIESLAAKLFPLFNQITTDDSVVVFEMPGRLELEFEGWELKKRFGKGKQQPTCCMYRRT